MLESGNDTAFPAKLIILHTTLAPHIPEMCPSWTPHNVIVAIKYSRDYIGNY